MREMKDSGVEWLGKIPTTWNVVPIKSIAKCFGRIGFRGYTTEDLVDEGEGAITLSPTHIIDNKINLENCSYLSWKKYYESPEIMVYKNDILFVKTASVGKCAIYQSEEAATVNPQFVVFKQVTCDYRFLYYCLVSDVIQQQLQLNNMGGVIATITQKDLLSYKIGIPCRNEQEIIANYLDSKCSQINSIIAKQEQIIEKLKEYKLSIITETVTKGLDPDVEMKDSGVGWIGDIPKSWTVYRIANLYDQTSEQGNEELPILTVSINSGISDRELRDDEQDRVFVRSDDRSKYKRVRPGDLAYNMMRAWQGAFGAVRVDGMVSPAYITCRPKKGVEIDTRYIEYLLRTPVATEEMHRYSHGIADFRLRLYWPEFKNIRLCFPNVEEQRSIADFLDNKGTVIDNTIKEREAIIEKLLDYKKSLIYEVVTGKKEV